METQPGDAFRDFVVERVEGEDGRYILYYRWPEPDAVAPEPPAEQEPPDV